MRVLEKIRGVFEQRPIWSRLALRNQLTESEDHTLMNTRTMWTYTGYIFSDGPWRDFHVNWGYDPRKTTDARIYQRMQFRNFDNEYNRPTAVKLKKSVAEAAGAEAEDDDWRGIGYQRNRNSHIFDGQVLYRQVGNYQLCDMTDPLLQRYITDPNVITQECHPIHGWYQPITWERIRAIARRKFTALLSGRTLTDAECEDLLQADIPRDTLRGELRRMAEARKVKELRDRGVVSRAKGRNMALGPMRPEEEAAERLRRRLEAAAERGEEGSEGSDVEME